MGETVYEELTIDEYIQEARTSCRKIKNILILALSTISTSRTESNALLESTAVCNIKGKEMPEEKYYYQLEPVPMMLTGYLKKAGEQIDEVIMICSASVLGQQKGIYLKPNPATHNEPELRIHLKNAAGAAEVSTRDFFVSRLKKYMSENGACEAPYIYEVDYQKADDVDEQGRLIGRIVAEIRQRSAQNETEIFIDTHGGPRQYQDVVNGVLSLVRSEGIDIKAENIFSVMYQNNKCEVVQTGLSMNILDFVTGMTELVNYGRTDTLTRFLDSMNAGEYDRKLIKTAGEIAEGMQFCNISEFESKLDELTFLMDGQDSQGDEKNELLNIFTENIRSIYKGLLQTGRTVVDEIQWSVDKGFYQQALTLIEGRMMCFMKEKGLFEYDDPVRDVGNEGRKDFELNNYIFNNISPALIPSDSRLNIFNGEKVEINDTVCKLKDLDIEIQVGQETSRDFLRLHLGFKTLRNISNHAADVQNPIINREQFEEKIDDYLECVRKMEESGEHISIKASTYGSVVCTANDENKWNADFKNDINGYGTYAKRGPVSMTADDTQTEIVANAHKTADNLAKFIAPVAVLDPQKAEFTSNDLLFWSQVGQDLAANGREVKYTSYVKTGIKKNNKDVLKYNGLSPEIIIQTQS